METLKKTKELESNSDLQHQNAEQNEGLSIDYHYESDEDQALGVETAAYQNGNTVKRIKLSTGKTAVVRELKGLEMKTVESRASGSQENAFPIMMSLATKIDGQAMIPEDFDSMKAKDWNKIKYAVASLNF